MKSVAEMRKPYKGAVRSLVIALDVGTTFSGVSYAILEPGQVPKIHGVTRFPGQEHVAGNSKIPTVLYYDKHGKMQAAGAEAERESVVAQAEDEQWIKAELFKLRLRPKSMKLQMNGMAFSPLPKRKSAVDVFGDFLGYLFRCTRSFVEDTHANGHALWSAVENEIQFVLSHPNGWEGAQQTKMRRAAVSAGMIPDTDEGRARIRFVTEGESSLHACVLNGLAADVLSNPSGNGFVVADAGGGTLDISSYAIRGTSPLVIEEIAPPDCIFAGSVFVSRRAKAFLQEKLADSKYGTSDSIDHITRRFDETTKRLFRDRNEAQYIPFGSPLDKDLKVGIRSGQLKLTGAEVAALFEPSIEAAVRAIEGQIDASKGLVKSVWLVGGFAASPWLFSQLQERLAQFGVAVSRPDTQTSKAVADGAVGFYCDHHVSARMSKFMYGVEYLREFDANDSDHVKRQDRLCELPSGPKLLLDAFDCILARSVRVKESTVFSRKYCTELTSLSTLSVFEVEIWCYRGGDSVPKWIMRNSDEFSTLCLVRADLSPLTASAQPKLGKNGKNFWTIVFSIEIHFGLTEFRARIKWVDTSGKTKYGPASIIYNESGHRAVEAEEADSNPDDDEGAPSRSSRPSSSRTHSTSREPVPATVSRSIAASEAAAPAPSRRSTASHGYAPASSARASEVAVTEKRPSTHSSRSSMYTNRQFLPEGGVSRAPSGAESTTVGGVPLEVVRTEGKRSSLSSGKNTPAGVRSRKDSLKSVTFSDPEHKSPHPPSVGGVRERGGIEPVVRSPETPFPTWGAPPLNARSDSHSSTIANQLGDVWSPGHGPEQASPVAPSYAGSRVGSTYGSGSRRSTQGGSGSREPSRHATPAAGTPRVDLPPPISSRAASAMAPSPRESSYGQTTGSAAEYYASKPASRAPTQGHATPRAPSEYQDPHEIFIPPALSRSPSDPRPVPNAGYDWKNPISASQAASAHQQDYGWDDGHGAAGQYGVPGDYGGHDEHRYGDYGRDTQGEQSLDDILAAVENKPAEGAAPSFFSSTSNLVPTGATGLLSDVLSSTSPVSATRPSSGWFSNPLGNVGNALGGLLSSSSRASGAAADAAPVSRSISAAAPSPRPPASLLPEQQSYYTPVVEPAVPVAAEEPASDAKGKKDKKGKKGKKGAAAEEESKPVTPAAVEPLPEVTSYLDAAPAASVVPSPAEEKKEDDWLGASTTTAKKGKKGKKGKEEEKKEVIPEPPLVVPEPIPEPAPEPAEPPAEETKAEDNWFAPAPAAKKGKKGKKGATSPWETEVEEKKEEIPPPTPEVVEPVVAPVEEPKADDDWLSSAAAGKKGKKGKKSNMFSFDADPEPEVPKVEEPVTAFAGSTFSTTAVEGKQDDWFAPAGKKDKAKKGKDSFSWGATDPEPAAPEPVFPAAEPVPVVPAIEETKEDDWFTSASAPPKTAAKKAKKGSMFGSWGADAEPEEAPVIPAEPAPVEPVAEAPKEDDWFSAATPSAKKGKKGAKKSSPFSWGADPEPEAEVQRPEEPPATTDIPIIPPPAAEEAKEDDWFSAVPVKKGKKGKDTGASEGWGAESEAAPAATTEGVGAQDDYQVVEPPAEEKPAGDDEWFSPAATGKKGKKTKKASAFAWDGEGEGAGATAEATPAETPAETPAQEKQEDDWFSPAAKGKKGKKGAKETTPVETPAEEKKEDDWQVLDGKEKAAGGAGEGDAAEGAEGGATTEGEKKDDAGGAPAGEGAEDWGMPVKAKKGKKKGKK